MTRTTIRIGAAALGVLLGVAACHNDQLFRPYPDGPLDPLFTRYVSMGNSITAGWQSDGINDSTQLQSYAVLLARQAQTPFFVPLMARPGCRPPYTNIYARTRVTLPGQPASTDTTCALRAPQAVPPPYINNTAVPNAEVLDGTTNFGPGTNANALTSFFLGTLTQTQMLMKVDPTFVTVWLGNNDVLGAATSSTNAGDSTRITDTLVFKAQYRQVLDSIALTSAQGGVLIGVANVTLIPYFSRGSKFFKVKAGTDSIAGPDSASRRFPVNFLVSPSCAPPHGDSVLVPFPSGAAVLAFARANPLATVGVNCDSIVHIQPAELVKLTTTVAAYNRVISAEAAARGYAYFDPNTLFTALPPGSIPTFPNVISTTAPFPAAITTPFGAFCSLHGVHPTAVSHKLVANALITVINTQYGSHIPAIP